MTISLEYEGCYKSYKQFFDEFARSMQIQGHKVGIITGEREVDPFTGKSHRDEIMSEIGFIPDFVYLWGANETIANGSLWKCQKMDQEDVLVHYSVDGREMKRYTERWVIKCMDVTNPDKF